MGVWLVNAGSHPPKMLNYWNVGLSFGVSLVDIVHIILISGDQCNNSGQPSIFGPKLLTYLLIHRCNISNAAENLMAPASRNTLIWSVLTSTVLSGSNQKLKRVHGSTTRNIRFGRQGGLDEPYVVCVHCRCISSTTPVR
jgi:hypothetical protein